MSDNEARYRELQERYEAGETELGIELAKLRKAVFARERRTPAAPVYRITLDISAGHHNSHEAFVIIDALKEYADTQRWQAEDNDNAEFLNALANTADQLRERIDAQLVTANIIERTA